jgi:cell division FtsZ-interacting protein ZapD
MPMNEALQRAIARGEYRIDANAVALAMVDRAQTLHTVRGLSEVLEAAERRDVQCVRAGEAEPFPMEDVA